MAATGLRKVQIALGPPAHIWICFVTGAVLASPITKGLVNALLTIQNQANVYGNIFVGTHALYSKGDYVSVEGK